MEFSKLGIPLLTMKEKLDALAYTINLSINERRSLEDAAGHLCDLLEWCRIRIKPSSRSQFKDLTEMVEYYGKDPTNIK